MFERKGECNNCGWCCQFEAVHRATAASATGEPLSASDQRFYALRGGQSVDGGKTVRYLMHAYVPCSAHDQDAQKCTVYDDRPDICRTFPSSPDQVEGSPCSHWFEAVVDGQLVRRGGGESPYPTPPRFD
jgi:Fe-S-cluster containining protein